MGTAPRTGIRDKATIKRILWAFAAGAIVMALLFGLVGNVDGSVGAMPATQASTAVVNDTSTEYRCYGDRDQLTQSAQKNFFMRNGFTRASATEYVSKPRTVVYGGSLVSLSVMYRSDVCSFTVRHEYVPSADVLRDQPADQTVELVYGRDGYVFKQSRKAGSCHAVLPPQFAIASNGVTDLLVVTCLYDA